MAGREIRDPIHGFIHLDESEIEIIDKPIFQRLRRIKQLAFAHLLYPGAMHTRFDHSLGVMHVAASMGHALRLEDEEIRWVRMTALLHDLGHGPFSHVSENLLALFAKPEIIQDQGLEEIHELITMQLIQDKSLPLSDPERERVIGILLSENDKKRELMVKFMKVKDHPPNPVLKQIISGPLDADKQDYLLRDSYFCGVKYGIFDMARLHNTLESESEQGVGKILAISEDGVNAVEQYIMAKYYMNTQIYRHRVRRITDAMLTRAIELGIEKDKIAFLINLYTYDGSEEFLKNYVAWDDERITREILEQGEGSVYTIFQRLASRKLFKQIYKQNLNNFGNVKVREALAKPTPEKKEEMENNIGEQLSFDPQWVILDVYKIKSAKKEVEGSEGRIRVKNKKTFNEESTLFNSISRAMEEQYVSVYAPADYASEAERQKKEPDWREKIEEVFEETLGREEQ